MDLARRLRKLEFVRPLGTTVNFYLPVAKMDDPRFGREGKTPKQWCDEFLLECCGGLTHEVSQIQGRWVADDGQRVLSDRHEHYEVSVPNKHRASELFEFLGELCAQLQEQSLYVTCAGQAWLVSPKTA